MIEVAILAAWIVAVIAAFMLGCKLAERWWP